MGPALTISTLPAVPSLASPALMVARAAKTTASPWRITSPPLVTRALPTRSPWPPRMVALSMSMEASVVMRTVPPLPSELAPAPTTASRPMMVIGP
jgi:hypothetical protein